MSLTIKSEKQNSMSFLDVNIICFPFIPFQPIMSAINTPNYKLDSN